MHQLYLSCPQFCMTITSEWHQTPLWKIVKASGFAQSLACCYHFDKTLTVNINWCHKSQSFENRLWRGPFNTRFPWTALFRCTVSKNTNFNSKSSVVSFLFCFYFTEKCKQFCKTVISFLLMISVHYDTKRKSIWNTVTSSVYPFWSHYYREDLFLCTYPSNTASTIFANCKVREMFPNA